MWTESRTYFKIVGDRSDTRGGFDRLAADAKCDPTWRWPGTTGTPQGILRYVLLRAGGQRDVAAGGEAGEAGTKRTNERMYASTSRCSSEESVPFQARIAVRGLPSAIACNNSLSDFAEVAAEIRLAGRGDRNAASCPSPRPVGPWQTTQCWSYSTRPRCGSPIGVARGAVVGKPATIKPRHSAKMSWRRRSNAGSIRMIGRAAGGDGFPRATLRTDPSLEA